MNYIKDKDLKNLTTFHLPVQCKFYIEYSTLEELMEIIATDLYKSNNSFHIGGGSNLLFTKDYEGLILHSKIEFIKINSETEDYVVVEAGAGMVWDNFVQYCVNHNFGGTENLSYIPGEVGASAIQNIGSYGAEAKDIIYAVHCIDKTTGESRTFTNGECHYGYRDSIFKNGLKDKYIVISVEYKLSKKPKFNLNYGPLKNLLNNNAEISLQKIRETIIEVRTSKLPDPKYIGSVGSFFKNPIISNEDFSQLQALYPDITHYIVDNSHTKVPAGWLIEHAGLKGYRIGDAAIFEKQCLVIVNYGNATSKEIINLYRHVIETIENKYGITLHPEANII